jgi:hypothetical protein
MLGQNNLLRLFFFVSAVLVVLFSFALFPTIRYSCVPGRAPELEATEQDGQRNFGLEQGQVLADAQPRAQPEGWRLPLGK